MKLEPECIGCLFNQVLKAFKLLDPDVSRERIIDAQKRLMKYLLTIDHRQKAAPIIGKTLYNIVAEMIGEDDPYSNLKNKYNKLVLDIYDDIEKTISEAKDPLLEAILLSALGNTIDFASQHEINLLEDIKNFSVDNFKINDYEKFRTSLNNFKELLIIGDNAGEIVFDKALISTLKSEYPDLRIIYSVRSAPIINDATMEDAEQVSLTKLVKVIETCPAPGIELETCTEEFLKYFYSKKNIVLSKGQGNFESLYGIPLPDKEIYFLMKVKCNLMERIFNVKIGDLIFKKGN